MPCKAVTLEDGKLGEITVPCMLVVEKISGDWFTIKPSAALNHLEPTEVVEVLIEGWYLIDKSKKPEFQTVGSTFDLKGKGLNWVLGPWQ